MTRLPKAMKRWKKQEKTTAHDLKGRVQPGSGNIRNVYLKEDVTSELFLCQCKTTDKGSFSIKKKEFDLTEERALRQCKSPLYRIDISGTDLAVMRYADFLQLLMDSKNATS